jgi:hypothetical protein
MKASDTGHERIDQRSIALHRAIAEKLAANPELLQIARDNLTRLTQKGGRSQPYWDAWNDLLAHPLPELLQQLTEDSERMRALRQATPFAGVLSPSERWAIYDRFKMPSVDQK